MLAVATACGGVCDEQDLALRTSAEVRRGRFVGGSVSFAASPAGDAVRTNCRDQLELLDDSFASVGELQLPYEYHDRTHVESLARDVDGSVAAITHELEYLGDIDESTATRLVYSDRYGGSRWTTVLETDELDATFRHVAFGVDQLFAVRYGTILHAFSRSTGALAWKVSYSISGYLPGITFAAEPNGGVIVAGTFSGALRIGDSGVTLSSAAQRGFISEHDSAGALRWARIVDDLGASAVQALALAPDGSIALSGTTEDSTRQFIALVDADGGVRWKHDAGDIYGDRAGTLATDGAHVVMAGDFTGTLPFDPLSRSSRDTDGYVAWFGSSGVETVELVTGAGTQRASVIALPTADSALVVTDNYADDHGVSETVVGGMTLAGDGVVIAELVR